MKADIIITNVMRNADGSHYAFAVESETGDGVFIPVNSISFVKFPVQEGCKYEAFLTSNKTHANTPWFCSLLSKPSENDLHNEPMVNHQPEEEPEPEEEPDPEAKAPIISNTQSIEEYINRCEIPVTPKQVFADLPITSESSIGSVLHQLYEKERIGKIIFSKGPKRYASFTAYCSRKILKQAYLDLIEDNWDDE